MRILLPIAAIVLASGCAGVEYRDTNAAVDANPRCVGNDARPGEPVMAECRRETGVKWLTEPQEERAPIDFSRKPKDD